MSPSPRDSDICEGHQELRDIVIETRSDVHHIRELLESINRCMCQHDERIRKIEIEGSSRTEDALEALNQATIARNGLADRVTALEKGFTAESSVMIARKGWIDSTFTKAGMLIGASLGIIAFLREVFT